jgi:Icc-related predicted phosphoesterase
MPHCFFVSDLHGRIERYKKLFNLILQERPAALFLGGDILPSHLSRLSSLDVAHQDFINDFLVRELQQIRGRLGTDYPAVFVILGNDDGRAEEAAMLDAASKGVWTYCHNRSIAWGDFTVYGYAYVPPTPFRLKDWERFDVSRYVDPGCISPEEGIHTVPVSEYEMRYTTIAEDLEKLAGAGNLEKAIFLFHSPPYRTKLDRAALDGKMIDHVPLDVHVGSIAIKRFIEERQPLITLHGHIHESTRLTGFFMDKKDRTFSFNASHDGPGLALVRFDPRCPESATLELI